MIALSLSARVRQSRRSSRGKIAASAHFHRSLHLPTARNGYLAGFRTFHGVAYRRGANRPHATGFAQRQQALLKVVLVQARARGIVHQHSIQLPGSACRPASTESARSAPPSTTVIWWMSGQRQLAKADIAGTDGNHRHALHARANSAATACSRTAFVTD